jgi:hypothetical protein
MRCRVIIAPDFTNHEHELEDEDGGGGKEDEKAGRGIPLHRIGMA